MKQTFFPTESPEIPFYSDWDDDQIMLILKHVLDFHQMPPGQEEHESAILAAQLVYLRDEPEGGRSVHMTMLGEIFFCDLVSQKNGEG